jgi:hypothetical protein
MVQFWKVLHICRDGQLQECRREHSSPPPMMTGVLWWCCVGGFTGDGELGCGEPCAWFLARHREIHLCLTLTFTSWQTTMPQLACWEGLPI